MQPNVSFKDQTFWDIFTLCKKYGGKNQIQSLYIPIEQ
jgi:hypothetical protein